LNAFNELCTFCHHLAIDEAILLGGWNQASHSGIEMFNEKCHFVRKKVMKPLYGIYGKSIDDWVTPQISSAQWLKRFNQSSPQEDR
jgi:hypothetical protein